MSTSLSAEYLMARRWETRLMITWIVMTFLVPFCAVLRPGAVSQLGVVTLVGGLCLYLVVSTFITPSYIGLEGSARLLLGLPPIMISALYFGMLDRWMRRMGFGRGFRFWVTSVAAICFVGPFVPALASPLLIVGALLSAYLRVRGNSSTGFLPAGVAITAAALLKFL
jgi:hypothetical protein